MKLLDKTSLINRIKCGERINSLEALELFNQKKYNLPFLGNLADIRKNFAKKDDYGNDSSKIVTYIIDRNINYTNVCNVACKFCSFYRTSKASDTYVLSIDEINHKLDELSDIGGVQVLLQGGHHPKLDMNYYIKMLSNIKTKFPKINIHGFSPPEILHFSKVFSLSVDSVLKEFKDAGLDSIPGAGAEILVDSVRKKIAPLKCDSESWLDVMRQAHLLGLNTSATMMFGHVESIEDRIEHLLKIRNLQDETGGFRAFICWNFQPENNILKALKTGPSDYLRTLAISRIFLDNVKNIQSSWVTQGPDIGQLSLKYGANDFGSVMMEENVVSQAGANFSLNDKEIENLISESGFIPKRRNTKYDLIN